MELYFSDNMDRNRFDTRIHFGGKSLEPLPPGHVYGPSACNAYLLQYCLEGKGIMEVDGNRISLVKGDLIVTFPGQIRYERADSQEPWAFLWVGLTGESTNLFFQQMGMTQENPVLPDCASSPIPALMEQLVVTDNEPGFHNDFLLGSKLFAFFGTCLRLHKERDAAPSAGFAYVRKAVAFLDANYTRQDLSVTELAQHLGLNRSYLYEVFKANTGLSPQEYLTRLRIRKSCELLQQPQTTAADAAYCVGYEPSVFAKAFKRAMGMTPGQYKKCYK